MIYLLHVYTTRDSGRHCARIYGSEGWDGVGKIPAEHAVRGLHSIELSEVVLDPTAGMLQDLLGMNFESESAGRANFAMGSGASGAKVEVLAGDLKMMLAARPISNWNLVSNSPILEMI